MTTTAFVALAGAATAEITVTVTVTVTARIGLQTTKGTAAVAFAENIIVMDQGNIVQAGTPSEFFGRPKTIFVGILSVHRR